MILLTRLGGAVFALNQDLIERADCTPDTVVTLVDGTKYVVGESLPDLVDLVLEFRAAVIAQAQHLDGAQTAQTAQAAQVGQRPQADAANSADAGTVVRLHRRDR